MKKGILMIFVLIFIYTSCKQEKIDKLSKDKTFLTVKTTNMKSQKDKLTLEYCMGKFDPIDSELFELINIMYADRKGMLLRNEAYESFKKMYAAAESENIKLIIKSATRNFNYQKGIWERKWNGKTKLSDGTNAAKMSSEILRAEKILNYSSMPGASRHHWGTDIDLNSFNNKYFATGEGLKIYIWLIDHAHEYGFCQPYTTKEKGRTGYNEEKWHWSYTPLSNEMTSYVKDHLRDEHFNGFDGSNTAPEIRVVENYVLGINSSCTTD